MSRNLLDFIENAPMANNSVKAKLDAWVEKRHEQFKKDILEWGYKEDSEQYKQQFTKLTVWIQGLIDFITQCTIQKENDMESLRKLYEYFENLTNNRDTAFIFKTLTGLDVGATNKKGMEAFVAYFGDTIPKEIAAKEAKAEEAKLQAEKDAKTEKEQAQKAYFKHDIWLHEKTAKLTHLQYGRVEKVLEKLWKFSSGVQSLKENLESIEIIGKKTTDNMHKWNRRKYNRMDGDEQRAYDARLKKGRTFYIQMPEGYCIEIPKIVYDLLDVKDNSEV